MLEFLVCRLLLAFLIVMFGRIVLSWFPMTPETMLAKVYSVLYALTEPILGPIRRVLPPVGMGGMGLDFSPIIVVVVIGILQQSLCAAA